MHSSKYPVPPQDLSPVQTSCSWSLLRWEQPHVLRVHCRASVLLPPPCLHLESFERSYSPRAPCGSAEAALEPRDNLYQVLLPSFCDVLQMRFQLPWQPSNTLLTFFCFHRTFCNSNSEEFYGQESIKKKIKRHNDFAYTLLIIAQNWNIRKY